MLEELSYFCVQHTATKRAGDDLDEAAKKKKKKKVVKPESNNTCKYAIGAATDALDQGVYVTGMPTEELTDTWIKVLKKLKVLIDVVLNR